MEYSIEFNGEVLNLYAPTIDTLEELDKAGNIIGDLSKPIKTRYKKMYETIVQFAGKEQVESVIGKIDKADPNLVNILYFKLVDAYKKPTEDYQSEEVRNKLNEYDLQGVTEIVKLLSNPGVERILQTSNGVPYRVK